MVKVVGSGIDEDLAPISDEDLLSRYRDSADPDDFNELVRRYERELYRYLARYLGNPAMAEDVFQNTFLQIHLKRALYEDGRPVRPWLYSIATHQAVDAMRKAGRHPTVSLDRRVASSAENDPGSLVDLLVGDGTTPLDDMQDQERRDWVARSVEKLPEALRHTLTLAYHQDLKYREIAEILKIPVGTVKSRLHAALIKLQEMARTSRQDGND